MKLIMLLLTIPLFINGVYIQEKIIKNYDRDWNELSKKKGYYLREITKITIQFITYKITTGKE